MTKFQDNEVRIYNWVGGFFELKAHGKLMTARKCKILIQLGTLNNGGGSVNSLVYIVQKQSC